jgi:membrane protein
VARQKQSILTIGLQKLQDFLAGGVVPVVGARPIINKLRTAGQFVHLVVTGFAQNRCPARAAALSYVTLLALVPLLAVVLSFSKSFLHDSSADVVPKLLDKVVAMVAPQLEYMPLPEDAAGPPAPGQAIVSSRARQETVQRIQQFIGNIHAGTLGAVGSVFLIFVAIRLLMTIERTFNDIWGVQKGRSVWRKIVYYWTTITLGPLLLLVAVSMTGTVEFSTLFGKLQFAPLFEKVLLHLAPFVVLWMAFSLMYALMPNTYVRPRAAIVGGIVGGSLWQLNNLLSTMYVSRVVTYSKIYGALGIIPVFLVGLYFAWLIVLLGAQVAFAAQNVRLYMLQRAGERIDEVGRELLACRMVLMASHSFLRGLKPPSVEEIAEKLKSPLQLLNQLAHRLAEGGVLSVVADEQGGLQPARPPESITVADVLHVVRTSDGICDQPARNAGGEPVEKLLADLYAAERTCPANARFSDLAEKFD